jgi:chitosanase
MIPPFQVGAYFWTADMDVDCDGIDYKCEGNGDGQPETKFGHLSAYATWVIICVSGSFLLTD